jgi:hypothetical protein
MKILILIITINWVYRLYEEYIISFKKFIKKYYNNNITFDIEYYDSINFNCKNMLNNIVNKKNIDISIENSSSNFTSINDLMFNIYDKVFYSGDIGIFSNIICPLFNPSNILNNKLYFINIEQLSKKSYYNMVFTINENNNIIDYSEENIVFLNEKYNNYLLLPFFDNFYFSPYIKNIDVLSITNNQYRKTFFNNIILDKKYTKLDIEDIYFFDRDDLFNKSKIYINIHSSTEHLTMEMIRIINLIMRKVIVISQNSVFKDILFFNKYIIICEDENDFSNTTNNILNNYHEYFYKIYKDFDDNYLEYIDFIKNNFDKLLS